MENQSIGVRLYNLRVDADYTQEDLAFKLNVSRQSISKWELDKTLPDTQKLIDLANLYGVSLDYIILGEDNNAREEDKAEQQEQPDSNNVMDNQPIRITQLDSDTAVSVNDAVYITNTKTKKALKNYCRIFFAIVSGVTFVVLLIFSLNLNSNLAVMSDSMKSKVVSIDNVYEQYTLAEITSLENDIIIKKKVWLDSNNISEGDSIFAYNDTEHPNEIKFQYYKKTLLTPLVVMLLFFALFIYFVLDIYNDSKAL